MFNYIVKIYVKLLIPYCALNFIKSEACGPILTSFTLTIVQMKHVMVKATSSDDLMQSFQLSHAVKIPFFQYVITISNQKCFFSSKSPFILIP